ncbi:peptidyl-prolyl cis-trans isomerase [Nocardioides sp. YIM B13467]|uniref:peptidyl-prolyl cis-trans isomerase n=1 Tax=Nocardioides sp. YIM B13467 TaxID=3366294 RepID=UPI003670973F
MTQLAIKPINVRSLIPSWWPRLLAAVVAVAVVGAGAFLVVQRANALPSDAAMKVGGRTVKISELDKRIKVLSGLYNVKQPTDATEKASFRRDAAKSMAVSLILERAAKSKGITVTRTQAQQQLDKVIESQMLGDQKTYEQFLATAGVTESEVLSEITRVIATSRLYSDITASVPEVTQAEVKSYYEDHKAEMVTPEQRSISNIVVATEAEADQVLAELAKGTEFAAVARSSSRDSGTAAKGGSLGAVQKSQLEDTYAKAAFGAAKGKVFGPVRTSSGWNVGVVTDVTEPIPVGLEDAAQTLTQTLTTQAQTKAWNKWLGRQIKAAEVEYANDYRPKDPDAPPATPAD